MSTDTEDMNKLIERLDGIFNGTQGILNSDLTNAVDEVVSEWRYTKDHIEELIKQVEDHEKTIDELREQVSDLMEQVYD